MVAGNQQQSDPNSTDAMLGELFVSLGMNELSVKTKASKGTKGSVAMKVDIGYWAAWREPKTEPVLAKEY